MYNKGKRLIFSIIIIFTSILLIKHNTYAETVSNINGKTVYTVYTREEFLTEVYNNIMNENCNVLIRMTDDALVKEMSYEMGLRQKTEDYYADEMIDFWYEGEDPPEFEDIIVANPMEYIQNDKELLDKYGVYNKYGTIRDMTDSFAWRNYTLTGKSDGWYWKFFSDDNTNISISDYETMMDKITIAMKTLNLVNQNDYQRLKTVSDWITSNAQYDYTFSNYTVYDNIVLGSSVCDGYAKATDLILSVLGYKTQYVIAENINHAWDIILLNNRWYMIDNTWDDCLSNYQYFLYGTETAADTIDMGGIIR